MLIGLLDTAGNKINNMGFFSNLGDALSGKIYKQNTLIGGNIASLLEKSQKLPDSKFVKHWAFACTLSCNVSLDYLLFEKKGEEINAFKQNIGKLNESRVFEIIKLLMGYHLSVFKRNEGNINFLKKLNINIDGLGEDVFSIFAFTRDDEKNFRELDKEFDNDSAKYFLHLYQKIFEKAYEMPDEKDAFGSLLMSGIISNTYTGVFINALDDKLRGK